MVLWSPFAEWCNHYSRLNCDFSFNDVLIFCKQYWGKKLKRYSKRPLKSGTYIKAGLSTWNILNSILLTTLLLFPDYLFWKYSSNHLNRVDDLFLIQTMVLCCIVCSGGKKMLTERDLYSDIPPWEGLKQIKDSLFCLRQSRDFTLNSRRILTPQNLDIIEHIPLHFLLLTNNSFMYSSKSTDYLAYTFVGLIVSTYLSAFYQAYTFVGLSMNSLPGFSRPSIALCVNYCSLILYMAPFRNTEIELASSFLAVLDPNSLALVLTINNSVYKKSPKILISDEFKVNLFFRRLKYNSWI